MQEQDFIAIGVILKPHGLKGHVVFKFYDENLKIDAVEHLFIKFQGMYLPYFVEEIKQLPKGFKIKLEEINDLESAQNLVNSELFLKPTEIEKLKKEESTSTIGIDGFDVFIDTKEKYLGVVSAIMENKYQDIIQVNHSSGKDILIPYVDVFVREINQKEKYIILYVPEGLIELYIGEKNI